MYHCSSFFKLPLTPLINVHHESVCFQTWIRDTLCNLLAIHFILILDISSNSAVTQNCYVIPLTHRLGFFFFHILWRHLWLTKVWLMQPEKCFYRNQQHSAIQDNYASKVLCMGMCSLNVVHHTHLLSISGIALCVRVLLKQSN